MHPSELSRVPGALRERPQWLVWRFEHGEAEKKPRKVPYYAGGGRRVGTQGDESDRTRLVTFDRAIQSVSSGKYTGIGFAFLPGDGLIGIDLDNCIDPDTGSITDRAAGIIKACGTYTEYSPSGKGVHLYGIGQTHSHKSNEIGVEVFCGRQFFTVTGRQYPDTPAYVALLSDAVVGRLHDVIDEARHKPRAARGAVTERQPPVGAFAERERIESALLSINADIGFNDWLAVGMALYDALGESVGLQVWDWWSSRGAKYGGATALERHWRTFGNRPAGSDAVIFSLAKSAGWKPPKPPHAASSSASRSAAEPSAQMPPGPPHDDGPKFRTTRDGKIQPSLYNTLQVLETDAEWQGVLGFNQFSYRITKRRAPPGAAASTGEWADIDDVRLQVFLTKVYGFEPKKLTVMDAVMQLAYSAPYHPVREYLEALRWDRVPRLPRLLAEHWGAISTPSAASLQREDPAAYARMRRYLELAGTKWMVGAVARIFKPGCKLDTMLVFEGGQGDFKSSSIRALFGDEWFSDSKMTIGDKDALAQMQGKWAYEMAEMDAHRKADDTAFKQFITTQVDRVRWHYGKRAEDVPRQCIFVGTTNMSQYGKDETGMRRIWPVEVWVIDVDRIRRERDQLWAEAVDRFRNGETWWIDKHAVALQPGDAGDQGWSEWALFEEQGESRQIIDAWETPIIEWLAANNGLPYVTTAQIMGDALVLDRARWSPPEQKRVAAILRRLGFKSKKVGSKYARINAWVKADGQPPEPSEVDDVPF